MFSRIRNHEKLVENGENPSVVARKLKEGTHEKDSDPFRILGNNGNSLKTVHTEDTVKMTENSIEETGGVKFNGGEIKIKGKGKGKGKGRDRGKEDKEEEKEEGAVTELIMKDPVDVEEDKNAFSLSLPLSLSLSLKKNKRPKNGTMNLEFNLSEVQDLHSYKEPSSKNYKGKNVLKEVASEVVRYDGEIFILF